MKQGFTLAQWKSGEIPVVPYPVANLKEARFKVDESTTNSLMLGVVLIPKPGAKEKAQEFDLGLKKVGNGIGPPLARRLLDAQVVARHPLESRPVAPEVAPPRGG